jgi:hypothetical protein
MTLVVEAMIINELVHEAGSFKEEFSILQGIV